MSVHERLRALGAAAAIGTDRAGGDADAPRGLLTEAARVGIQSRAGWRPPAVAARLPECPDDDRALAPAPALATLRRLLADGDAALIDEWFELARVRGVGVDAATVPVALEWAVGQPGRADSIMDVLGRRGSWLAALNPAWQSKGAQLPANADEVWQTGRSAERLTLLAAVRRRDPDRARALVEATWSADGAADREQFIERLIDNRSQTDEPFLERALDDRSKIVRRKAAAVLALIPGSTLRARLTAVATGVLRVTAGASTSGEERLALAPPVAFDPRWTRDGIEERPPRGVGPRAWWLRQIVERADLSIWTAVAGLDADAILDAVKNDDYAADFVLGLTAAARLAGDAQWIAALVRHLNSRPDVDLMAVASLLTALSDEAGGALTIDVLAGIAPDPLERWPFLSTFDRPWSVAFSEQAMILAAVARATANDWRLLRAIDAVSRRIAPDAQAAFERALTQLFPDGLPASAVNSIERVRLRADMRKEFGS